MINKNITELTESNFYSYINSPTPVLVDFQATWCGPCKMLAPVIDQIAQEKAGKLVVGSVDVNDNAQLASRFGVQNVPTILIFKDGDVVEQINGMISKKDLVQKIDAAIK